MRPPAQAPPGHAAEQIERRIPLVGAGAPAEESADRVATTAAFGFILVAVVSLASGAVLLALWGPQIVGDGAWGAPRALALTHVLSLGVATAMAMGVIYHVGPLMAGRQLPLQRAALAVCAGYAVAVPLFVTGLATSMPWLIATAASLLGLVIAAFIAQTLPMLLRSRRRHWPQRYLITALTFLAGVAVAGPLLAIGITTGLLTDPSRVLGAKILLAVGGWLGILVAGMLYSMVPMFTPTRGRARLQGAVLAGAGGGTLLAAVATVAALPGWLTIAALALLLATALVFAADVARLMARRSGRITPVLAGQAAGLALLVAGAALGLAAGLGSVRWAAAAVVTAIFGWVPVLIAANATRLIPFVLWRRRGPGRRPRIYRSTPPAIAWPAVACPVAGWALLGAAVATSSETLALAGAVAFGGAALGLVAVAVEAAVQNRRPPAPRPDPVTPAVEGP